MKTVVNGSMHSYEVVGSGPHVTLLHSVGLSTRKGWRNQIPVLSEQYTVLSYDIRGCGESERGAEPLGIEPFDRDLEALLATLNIKKTFFYRSVCRRFYRASLHRRTS